MLESQKVYDELVELIESGQYEAAKQPAKRLKEMLDELEEEATVGELPHDALPKSEITFKSVTVQHMFLSLYCHYVLTDHFTKLRKNGSNIST